MIVEVYRNLSKRVFSIRHKGVVIGYASNVELSDAVFRVREGGRRRVLESRQKNVHAFVKGTLVSTGSLDVRGEGVTYDPYKYSTFVRCSDGSEIHESERVFLVYDSDNSCKTYTV